MIGTFGPAGKTAGTAASVVKEAEMTELLSEPPVEALTAESVMHREVLTVTAATSVGEVWDAMRTSHVEHAVVVDQGLCLGIVALSELWVAWTLELAPVRARPVRPLVTPAPAVARDTTLPRLCQVLLHSRYGAAMVLDDVGDLQGLVTMDDVLDRLARSGGVSS
jgi:CBS-domain-containing membrane protein